MPMSNLPPSEFETVSPEKLKERFDEARKQGKDFLVKVSYVLPSMPIVVPGAPIAINTVRVMEDTYGISKDTLADDLVDIYKGRNELNILSVYDLSESFNLNARGGTDMLPETGYKEALAQIAQLKEEREAALKARPLWKKILGLEP